MHTVELLEEAVGTAASLGYRIRQEWLGGSGGGVCEIKGRRMIFLDLALDPSDHLLVVVQALRDDARAHASSLSPELRRLLQMRKSA